MKLAAIDIGSNAIRLLIEEARGTGSNLYFKKISLTRVPIRLGEDVFSRNEISTKKQEHLVKSMIAFKHLMEVNDVEAYRAVATSAMREARNGDDAVAWVRGLAGVNIEIIQGKEEADLIFSNFFMQNHTDVGSKYLYIDVGGGSTELTLIKNNKRITSASFKLGTVRLLADKVDPGVWDDMLKWVKAKTSNGGQELIAIGTGGNINRLYKESKRRFQEQITYKEIKQVADFIDSFSLEDRIKKLKLKPDRADVIIPASKIYLSVMKAAGTTKMIVPKVGLSDGIIYHLYKSRKKSKK